MNPTKGLFWVILLSVVAGSDERARACSIPVFRYALERWRPDRYDVIVFHRGPFAPQDRAVVDGLERRASGETAGCNYVVRLVDLQGPPDEAMQLLGKARASSPLPWIVLRSPARGQPGASVWSGRLSEAAAELLIDSPARREIAKRIVGGQAAVWVLLESGSREKDDATYALLQAELRKLEKILKPPSPAPGLGLEAEDEIGPVPQVTFSVVRVSRSDPAERVLVNVLLDSESDLRTFSQPMAFPVFGRGRVLYALVGRGINESNIGEACAFLVDGCSCLVKADNQGVDLLMTADWAAALEDEPDAAWASSLPIGVSTEGGSATAGVEGVRDGGASTLLRNSLLAVAGGVMIVALAAWILAAKDRGCRSEK